MGIKNYLKYLDDNSCQIKIREYDYIYFDCNYMIHYLIYKCKNDNDLYSKIYQYWDYLISIIKINEIYLVFDGEYDNNNYIDPKYETHLLRSKYKTNSNEYDKQLIYPGSDIIKIFKEYFIEIIERYKKINKYKIKINIIGDDIKGEADLKILDIIYNSNQNNICICSKDSDMILIGHSLCISKKIKIDILSNLRPVKFIDIEQFNNYGYDYILIVLFLGNDYLPKISNINYLLLIDSYSEYIKFNKSIIINNTINYNSLINFISIVIIKSKKKIKFKFDKINHYTFNIYFNNLLWCLKYYKAIDNQNYYKQNLKSNLIKNVIDIFNFINFYPMLI